MVSSQHSSDEEEEFIQPNFSRPIESSSESDEEEEPPLKRFCRDAFFEEGVDANLPSPLDNPDTQTWIKRVMITLRSTSVGESEKANHPFKSLAKQWVATGKYIGMGSACATCELCTKERIRYLFIIKNTLNKNKLKIGSKCIEHFSTLGLAFQPAAQAEPCSIEESSQKISEMVTKTQQEGQQYTNMMQSYCRRS